MGRETAVWAPLGRLMADYLAGRMDAEAGVIWEDGARASLRASVFFRQFEELSESELRALELCRGKVLDIGAGAGCHALVLQEQGGRVRALDICPRSVEVMAERGVEDARAADIFRCSSEVLEGFETWLLLMNGIGLVGDLDGFDRFLALADRWLAPGGQILFDSADLRLTDDHRELRRLTERVRQGRYRGETRQRVEYEGRLGAELEWLYLDPQTLRDRALSRGWYSQVIYEEMDGTYLACLVRAERPLKDLSTPMESDP